MYRLLYDNLHTTFFFSSILITPLLSPGLRSELKLLFVSEMWILHILLLTFGDWLLGIAASRRFKPKSDHLKERLYCKPIKNQQRLGQLLGINHFRVWEDLVFADLRTKNYIRIRRLEKKCHKTKLSTVSK